MSSFTTVCKDTKELKPIPRYLYSLAVKEIVANGITPLLVETYRSQERQMYLYCQGRSVSQAVAAGISSSFAQSYCRGGNQVTWTLSSKHKTRTALDLIPQRKVNGTWTAIWSVGDAQFQKIITIMEKYGFEAGARWSTPDSDHFQIAFTPGVALSKTNTTTNMTKMIQRQLNKALKNVKGFEALSVDGAWGAKTDKAIKMFRKKEKWSEQNWIRLAGLKKLMSY